MSSLDSPRRVGSFTKIAEALDPKLKNARVLSPLNTNEKTPWFFFAKEITSSTPRGGSSEAKLPVILQITHDGICWVPARSHDEINAEEVRTDFRRAKVYSWSQVVRYNVAASLHEFVFVWYDPETHGEDYQTNNTTFRFKSHDWEGIGDAITRVMKDLAPEFKGTNAAALPPSERKLVSKSSEQKLDSSKRRDSAPNLRLNLAGMTGLGGSGKTGKTPRSARTGGSGSKSNRTPRSPDSPGSKDSASLLTETPRDD